VVREETRAFLEELPLTKALRDRHAFVAHGTPDEPEKWHYLCSLRDAEKSFHQFEEQICFVGHSHQPFIIERLPSGEMLWYRSAITGGETERYIVNVGSVLGLVGFPTEGAYNMSKFAVRAFTECLWSELDGTGVRAVSVLPGFVRTNIGKAARRCAEWGPEEARVGGIAMRLMTTSPEKCAADIVAGIERGKKRILTGNLAFRLDWLSRLLPSAYPAVLKPLLNSHDRSRRATGRGKSS
jgi:diadenosine tetraphosphatase ApaH/serine/threonine PP2A family protein phosphatase